MSRILISSIIIGTVSGLMLLLFFAYIQMLSGINLMDLLLNTDFIFGGRLGMMTEIMLHLGISVVIAFILKVVHVHRHWWYLPVTILMLLISVLLYFILQWAGDSVYISDNSIGLILWGIFHIGYFELIYYMYRSGY
ncbi:hypothetical protein [Lacicoccus alkaliphilus]|uniref:Uncharacterized protein n=1 Tax=Lacicoccus alkaliphilus DSM 16010 TaxID=1123231 RepID=A0A1M7J4J8_9BACL|nr:hypothetical protein [Salinicoccus alkaliphilus]SHM47872.1 hypothetical protein SAMN02745189_02216 [Salinicoccus alkaliphilus DSM 16010]